MANSAYEYVKKYELDDTLLPGCYVVVRIDGRAFHRFSAAHKWRKPNDDRALQLMNACARHVMEQFGECVIAIGMSDEFSFVFRRDTTLFSRRSAKLNSVVCSAFAGQYVFLWPQYFPDASDRLQFAPQFDSRVVCYPTDDSVKDYLRWRQVDAHVNNLYNTCFWALVLRSGRTERQAHDELLAKYPLSKDKHELLFGTYGVNYDALPNIYRKGSILLWENVPPPQPGAPAGAAAAAVGAGAAADAKSAATGQPRDDGSLPPPKAAPAPLNKKKRKGLKSEAAAKAAAAEGGSDSEGDGDGDGDGDGSGGVYGTPARVRRRVVVVHEDLISEEFWTRRAGIIPSLSKQQLKKLAAKAYKKEHKHQHQHQQHAAANANGSGNGNGNGTGAAAGAGAGADAKADAAATGADAAGRNHLLILKIDTPNAGLQTLHFYDGDTALGVASAFCRRFGLTDAHRDLLATQIDSNLLQLRNKQPLPQPPQQQLQDEGPVEGAQSPPQQQASPQPQGHGQPQPPSDAKLRQTQALQQRFLELLSPDAPAAAAAAAAVDAAAAQQNPW